MRIQELRDPRQKIYIALLELNLSWSKREVGEFQKKWHEGDSIIELADHFYRPVDEIALLIIDLAHYGYLLPRSNGLNSSKEQSIQKKFKSSRNRYYESLVDFDFCWDEKEVLEFIRLWTSNQSLLEIAKHFDRHVIDVAILIIDQTRKDKIFPRKHGLFGKDGEMSEIITKRAS